MDWEPYTGRKVVCVRDAWNCYTSALPKAQVRFSPLPAGVESPWGALS